MVYLIVRKSWFLLALAVWLVTGGSADAVPFVSGNSAGFVSSVASTSANQAGEGVSLWGILNPWSSALAASEGGVETRFVDLNLVVSACPQLQTIHARMLALGDVDLGLLFRKKTSGPSCPVKNGTPPVPQGPVSQVALPAYLDLPCPPLVSAVTADYCLFLPEPHLLALYRPPRAS